MRVHEYKRQYRYMLQRWRERTNAICLHSQKQYNRLVTNERDIAERDTGAILTRRRPEEVLAA